MLPLKDDVPTRSVPLVNVGLIVLNGVAFAYQVSLGVGEGGIGSDPVQAFVVEFGLIPCRLAGRCQPFGELPPPALTLFTSMFLHGGLFHVFGNMLYLWIFGNNVEGSLGHGRYLVFYLTSGAAAAMSQTLVNPASSVPMVGASGAVSGVLGAYLLLFPHARVLTLFVLGFFVRLVRVPALIVLGFWIVVQVVNGFLSIGESMARSGGAVGGVAWFAHIGGCLAGMLLLLALRPRTRARTR